MKKLQAQCSLARHLTMSLRPPMIPNLPFCHPHTGGLRTAHRKWWCHFPGEVLQALWLLPGWLLDFSPSLKQTVRSYEGGRGRTEATDPLPRRENPLPTTVWETVDADSRPCQALCWLQPSLTSPSPPNRPLAKPTRISDLQKLQGS